LTEVEILRVNAGSYTYVLFEGDLVIYVTTPLGLKYEHVIVQLTRQTLGVRMDV
jgi:hypothetical protein